MIISNHAARAHFPQAVQALGYRMPSLVNHVAVFYVSIVKLFGNFGVLNFVFADTFTMSNHSVDGQQSEVRSQRNHRKRCYGWRQLLGRSLPIR